MYIFFLRHIVYLNLRSTYNPSDEASAARLKIAYHRLLPCDFALPDHQEATTSTEAITTLREML